MTWQTSSARKASAWWHEARRTSPGHPIWQCIGISTANHLAALDASWGLVCKRGSLHAGGMSLMQWKRKGRQRLTARLVAHLLLIQEAQKQQLGGCPASEPS